MAVRQVTLSTVVDRITTLLNDFPDDLISLATPPLPAVAEAALLWALRARFDRPLVWICDGQESLETMHQDLLGLKPKDGAPVLYLPPWSTIPSQDDPPDREIAGHRLTVLATLDANRGAPGNAPLIVTCIQALMPKTLSPDHLGTQTHVLACGDEIEPDALTESLVAGGYKRGHVVDEKGQVAVRGGLLDVWPLSHTWPVRIEFFGDTVESIRCFDPATQRSIEKQPDVSIPPAGEWQDDDARCTVLEYLPENSLLAWSNPDAVQHHGELFETAVRERRRGRDIESLERLMKTLHALPNAVQVNVGGFGSDSATQILEDVSPLPDLLPEAKGVLQPDLLDQARRRMLTALQGEADQGDAVFIALDTAAAVEHLQTTITETIGTRRRRRALHVVTAVLSEGFRSDALQLTVVAQPDLYGYHKQQGRRYDPLTATGKQRPRSTARIAEMADLEPGDLVVHVEHGIGRYEGLSQITFNGQEQEVLTVEYADNARLHVPISQAHLLSRYVGVSRASAPLHKLGGRRWNRERESAEAAIADMAASMLETQARRNLKRGHAFGEDVAWQHEFEAAFPYRETQDQHDVIAAVKTDMASSRPMDRLLCGDAGYGKTEVAMRAAFKAVMGQRQVAVLVPTTVLAQQHFETFAARMADYPIQIEMLSRFRSQGQRAATLKSMAEGKVDIVIGTHALLQEGVVFEDLGLVIIDEEQRFGVAHKEAFKQIRTLVDVLTLTATPIPRTLYMSMTGARDLSLLQTPPLERLAIETTATRYSEATVRQAILREINREGQAFYLHNRVMTIESICNRLRELVPEARFEIAHGQMPAGELARVMSRFVNGEFDILVCTTIIESGMDIPRANTILIDRADRFGIADLYQLRGRVGRSSRKAYAILLLPPQGHVDSDARKRIGALRKYSSLSAGFNLALRDLEIRGAGNLLGTAQSGHITAIGFGLYCQLLKRTVARLKGEPVPRLVDVDVTFDFLDLSPVGDPTPSTAGIPYNYISDEGLRVGVYRQLAEASDNQDLARLEEELVDRFGTLPIATRRLLAISRIRICAADHDIRRVETRDDKLMLTGPRDYLMQGTRFPRLTASAVEGRLDEIMELIETSETWAR
ncbi:MAG: transcription-repair coupling factor [Kiritimatiellia bacterium]|nr:transcription-repair coupling factor [Kiritimatiellia bacterium]MDP6630550.1 transcription-repair coupling factor [Kiritimatiellia bacterium]MDP6811224.1 transcription-repair coupling factor [Kiritimatiellia bacterium]MDP7024331.1 transcription-repair coupling factor [Kiritimatiellia bacterium]